MSRNNNQAKALVDAWIILLRHKWRFIIPTFAVMAVILAASLMLPRKYRAEAIFDRRTDVVLNEIMTHTAFDAYDDPRQSISQELSGGPAIDRVIEELQPYVESRVRAGGPRMNLHELRADLARKVIVKFDIATKGHERIRISYTGEDPVFARLAVNIMARNYIDASRESIDKDLSDAGDFFNQQVNDARQKIEKLEDQKLTYEIEYADLLPSNRLGIHEIQNEVEQHVAELRRMRDASAARLEKIQEQLAQTPTQVESFIKERNPELTKAQQKLVDFEQMYRRLVTVNKMTERHPDLVDLKEQIAGLREAISTMDKEVITQTRFAENPKRAELELLLASNETEHEALVRQVGEAEARLKKTTTSAASLFPVRAGYRKINREIEQLQREVGFWEEKLRRVEMAETAESGNRGINLEFVRPCPKLGMPVSPDITQILIAAIGMGLMAGSVSLLFAHRMDETAHDAEGLAKSLDMTLIGVVSEITTAHQKRVNWMKKAVIFPVNAAVMAVIIGVLVGMLYTNLKSPKLYDQFKKDPSKFVQDQISEVAGD